MAANLRICSAVAALALLTTPAASFMAAPPAHSMRATHVLQRGGRREAPSLGLPVQLRTLKATKMVGTTGGGGKDFTGEDGLFGFVGGGPAGASKFPMPGNDKSWMSLSRVCVLLFNPRTENEGIYTLQLRVREGCVNTVVLFEEREDAERFAGLLEAQVIILHTRLYACIPVHITRLHLSPHMDSEYVYCRTFQRRRLKH